MNNLSRWFLLTLLLTAVTPTWAESRFYFGINVSRGSAGERWHRHEHWRYEPNHYWGVPGAGWRTMYYTQPVLVPPRVVIVNEPEIQYVQRAPEPIINVLPAAPMQAEQYWYYCEDSKSYYPYVKECSAAWRKVPSVPQ